MLVPHRNCPPISPLPPATNLRPQNLTKHACTFPAALVDMLRRQLAQPSRPLTLEEATEVRQEMPFLWLCPSCG